jgi:opacity protein-like surface antigen
MRVGWTGGGGLEWMFCRHWSIKVEYLFYDLGSESYDLDPLNQFGHKAIALAAKSASRSATQVNAPGGTGPNLETVGASRSTATFDGNIVRAGLNFHF